MVQVSVSPGKGSVQIQKLELYRRLGFWMFELKTSDPLFNFKVSCSGGNLFLSVFPQNSNGEGASSARVSAGTPFESEFLNKCRWFFGRRSGCGQVVLVDEEFVHRSASNLLFAHQ